MRKWRVGSKMIKDPAMRRCLGEMSGIEARVSGEAVKDYRSLYAGIIV